MTTTAASTVEYDILQTFIAFGRTYRKGEKLTGDDIDLWKPPQAASAEIAILFAHGKMAAPATAAPATAAPSSIAPNPANPIPNAAALAADEARLKALKDEEAALEAKIHADGGK